MPQNSRLWTVWVGKLRKKSSSAGNTLRFVPAFIIEPIPLLFWDRCLHPRHQFLGLPLIRVSLAFAFCVNVPNIRLHRLKGNLSSSTIARRYWFNTRGWPEAKELRAYGWKERTIIETQPCLAIFGLMPYFCAAATRCQSWKCSLQYYQHP